ncbi:MAG: tRNA uridine-5-carboxymethylaminomethyl(34) synthesis enzyme MnmG, partial [Planctomycetota bacterium]
PENDLATLVASVPNAEGKELDALWMKHRRALRSLAIDSRYEGYLVKQRSALMHMQQLDAKRIPPDLDYSSLPQLRHEAREKFIAVRPHSLGQAFRISGITPADITILAIHLTANQH